MSEKVYVERIDIQNIGGLEEFHAELGAINLVVGENGTGKSSVLNALEIVLGGGSDPDLIHNKHDHGEVLLTLSDGTTVHKSMERDGSADLKIRTRDGGAVKAPATYLKTLAAGLGFDPIAFLESDPKERAAFLLQNLPLTFSADSVNDALGSPILSAPVTLQKLNELRLGNYDERTSLNRKTRDLEGTIKDMERALPADPGKNWSAERDRLSGKLSTVGAEIRTLASQIELEAEQEKTRKRSEIQEKIAALNRELSDHLVVVEKTAAATLAESTATLESERASLSEELGTAKARADQEQQAVGIRNAIVDRKKALEGHISEEMRLSKVIERLDKLKHAKLKELPIDGLDLKVDSKGRPVILIGGLPLDKLNRQQQLYVAIQAVSLAEGKLPLILCEAAELDDKHIEELSEAAKGAGLQLVLARWKNHSPLEVLTV